MKDDGGGEGEREGEDGFLSPLTLLSFSAGSRLFISAPVLHVVVVL
jgi:hypothetical protein